MSMNLLLLPKISYTVSLFHITVTTNPSFFLTNVLYFFPSAYSIMLQYGQNLWAHSYDITIFWKTIYFILPKHTKICETFGLWNFTDFSDNDGNINVLVCPHTTTI